MAFFAAALVGAILRGTAGAPCACFGSRSTVGWGSVARNLALAACFAALPLCPSGASRPTSGSGSGSVVALLACAGLGVAVLALAREVGMLRLRLGPGSRRSRSPTRARRSASGWTLIDRFAEPAGRGAGARRLHLRGLPRLPRARAGDRERSRGDPVLAVEVFDEVARRATSGASCAIPG